MDSTSYSIAEAAEALNLSAKTIRRYIKAGKLQSVKVASKYGEEYRITELPESLKQAKPEVDDGADEPDTAAPPPPTQQVGIPLDAYQLYQENIRLAAQIGAATERIRQLEEKLKLLQAPPPAPKPWWRRIFGVP